MKSKLKIRSGIDLVPFIDMILFLVIYFLLNSTLEQNRALNIDLPKSTTAKGKVEKTIVISINNKNEIFLEQEKLPLEKLPVELKKIIQFIL